jgi:hypothetical protein
MSPLNIESNGIIDSDVYTVTPKEKQFTICDSIKLIVDDQVMISIDPVEKKISFSGINLLPSENSTISTMLEYCGFKTSLCSLTAEWNSVSLWSMDYSNKPVVLGSFEFN